MLTAFLRLNICSLFRYFSHDNKRRSHVRGRICCVRVVMSLALDVNIRTVSEVEYELSVCFHMCGWTLRIFSKREAEMCRNQIDLVGVTDQELACAM